MSEYKTGTIGHGAVIHLLSGSRVACGSGECSIGTKRVMRIRVNDKNVTCKKCLKIIKQKEVM